MIIGEIIIAAIADAVFGFIAVHWGAAFTDKARDLLGKNSTKKAFKEALAATFARFQAQAQYKEWIDSSFDASFFAHEGAPILAQFLLRDGHPDPSDLAARWTDSLNLRQPERRAFYTRELESIAAAFLAIFSEQLKNKIELRDLFNDRAFEQLAQDLHEIRQSLGVEKSTPGTRRDYLRWLLERNLYLDPRGTLRTQRQVQVKLDEVYVSLKAQREVSPGQADRLQVEQELAGLKTKLAPHSLAAEEIEDQYDRLLTGLEKRAFAAVDGPGEVLELAECVRRHDRLVILGDPGSGKTTLLRYLALTHAKALWNKRSETSSGPAHFPILLRISEYAEDGRWKKMSLSDFLIQYHILHECPLHSLADLFHTELEQGHCLILLDGLDEIVSANDRRDVVQRMEDFVQRHSGKANRFVITSRVAGYRSAPLSGPFTHFTIQDMEETQIRRFLERWCQAVEDAQTPEVSLQERQKVAQREIDGIMKAVHLTPGVRRLAANPLLLCTLALIHRTGAQLPQKRIELYKLAADVLGRTWRLAQNMPESALVKDEYLTPMLSKLAYWLHVHKPTGIATEREVYAVLGEEWARLNDIVWDKDEPAPKIKDEIRTFLLAVREHTGLFVERAPRRYGFMHLTFEEYYVARYLVARSKWRVKLVRQHLQDPVGKSQFC